MKQRLQHKLTKEILEYEYATLGSITKISEKIGVDQKTISKYMKLYAIPYNKHYSGIYECNHNFFSQENEMNFYLAGFIAADGSLQNRNNSSTSKVLKITLSENDFTHLEKIKNILESTHPIKKYKVKPSKLIKTSHNCVELQIASKQIFDDLEKFNIIPNKTFVYEIPNWLQQHELVNHFMRGYFDGDGTISYCGLSKDRIIKQLSFSLLGTEKFCEQYQNILIENCFLNKTKIFKHYSVHRISYSGNIVVKNIYDFLYENATIYLDRKYHKFFNHFNQIDVTTEKLP